MTIFFFKHMKLKLIQLESLEEGPLKWIVLSIVEWSVQYILVKIHSFRCSLKRLMTMLFSLICHLHKKFGYCCFRWLKGDTYVQFKESFNTQWNSSSNPNLKWFCFLPCWTNAQVYSRTPWLHCWVWLQVQQSTALTTPNFWKSHFQFGLNCKCSTIMHMLAASMFFIFLFKPLHFLFPRDIKTTLTNRLCVMCVFMIM